MKALAVNLSSAFHAIRLTVPLMRQRHWVRIHETFRPSTAFRGPPMERAYVKPKTALIGLTRAVALETIGDNITCNAYLSRHGPRRRSTKPPFSR